MCIYNSILGNEKNKIFVYYILERDITVTSVQHISASTVQ